MPCNTQGCNLKKFPGHNECVLHCVKGDYPDDFINHNLLNEFYDELINYIDAFIWKYHGNTKLFRALGKDYVQEALREDDRPFNLTKKDITLDGIFFPCRKGRDTFDYLKVLKKLSGIHFIRCKFTSHSLELNDVETFFDECEFYQWWSLTRSKTLQNVNNVLYQMCIFYSDVSSYADDNGIGLISTQLFNDCNFKKKLELTSTTFEAPIFNNSDGMDLNCDYLQIHDCKLEDKFSLNNTSLKNLDIRNTEFLDKFEFKKNSVIDFKLDNVNFTKIFDAYNTKFECFSIHKSIFNDFVGFEKCKFGAQNSTERIHLSKFIYVTFLSFTNFRNTIFYSGLDIEDTNLKEPPNFLNVYTNFKTTNRETYRIIKNSFDGIGNHIEANKFYVFEMGKYKEDLKDENWTQEKFVFYMNSIISNFGNSFLRPFVWLISTSIIYYLIVLGYKNKILYQFNPILSGNISVAIKQLDVIALQFQPFKTFLAEGMEFLSLIFYIISVSLIWQIIVAIKRYTKR